MHWSLGNQKRVSYARNPFSPLVICSKASPSEENKPKVLQQLRAQHHACMTRTGTWQREVLRKFQDIELICKVQAESTSISWFPSILAHGK